jgi:hypothetical protein
MGDIGVFMKGHGTVPQQSADNGKGNFSVVMETHTFISCKS